MNKARDLFKQWAKEYEIDDTLHEEWTLFESIYKLRDAEVAELKQTIRHLREAVWQVH